MKKPILAIALALAFGGAHGQNIDFGNDASFWSNDGECDDPRFEGPGMASGALRDQDRLRDATDCENLYQSGDVWLVGEGPSSAAARNDSQGLGSASLTLHDNGAISLTCPNQTLPGEYVNLLAQVSIQLTSAGRDEYLPRIESYIRSFMRENEGWSRERESSALLNELCAAVVEGDN